MMQSPTGSGTTEIEIFDCIAENLRIAAEKCAVLAWHPRRGFEYDAFRRALKLVEGGCRQAYYWRDYDARWLALGQLCAFAHQRAGDWIRGKKIAGPGGSIAYTGGSIAARKLAHPEFGWLAEKLAKMHKDAERLKTMATGRLGPILPAIQSGPLRDTRPVSILLPQGFVDARAPRERRHA